MFIRNKLKFLNILNKLKKINKNTNKWIFLILIGFIYQLIDLTIDYLSYNYVIETNITHEYSTLPSITICIDKNNSYINNNSVYPIDTEYNKIYCYFIDTQTDRYYYLDCYNISKTYIRYKNKSICLTFFDDNYLISKYHPDYISFEILWANEAKVTIHPIYSPSHFYWNYKITVKYSKIYYFFNKEYVKNLLPHPFATNCFDYSINQRNNVRPKSQSDCKLQQMESMERKKCGQNYYWEQKELKSGLEEYGNTGLYCSIYL